MGNTVGFEPKDYKVRLLSFQQKSYQTIFHVRLMGRTVSSEETYEFGSNPSHGAIKIKIRR